MPKYHGSWPTMVTPFDPDLQIDVGVYRAMIDWYVTHGADGLYANCLSSEMYLLDEDEQLLLVTEAVSAARGRIPVAATANLAETVEEQVRFCRRVADCGADVVMLIVPPAYENDAELERYYLNLAEQVDAPLGLYECPVPRRYHLGVALVQTLAQTGRFVAYKETSCDLAKIHALIEVTKDTPLSLLQANVSYLLEAVKAGAPGTMSIGSICWPDLVGAVIEKGKAGDPDAERLQNILCAVYWVHKCVHPAGSKYLLSKRGVPISHRSRVDSTLSPETIYGLDCSAVEWFREDGSLIALEA